MRVKDERAWREQLVEFDRDEDSRRFRDFLLAWVAAAEAVGGPDARAAMLAGFESAEGESGYLSVEWLSQMLLVVVQHWFNGDQLWESLSAWERRMVEQATAVKLVELQQVAAAAAAPDIEG